MSKKDQVNTNVGVLSFGKRGDFELLQVKYPIQYEWQ
jgi:hypothetical protein